MKFFPFLKSSAIFYYPGIYGPLLVTPKLKRKYGQAILDASDGLQLTHFHLKHPIGKKIYKPLGAYRELLRFESISNEELDYFERAIDDLSIKYNEAF